MVTQLVPVLALMSLNSLGSMLVTALGLGLVIFFHELGHFLVAKWCGVYVERFSIGFGHPVLARKWGDTEYALGWLPLGGYVKMRGQDDMDPGEMTDEVVAQDPRSYTAKSVPQRMAIISAGVIMNVITGTIFFILAFMLGVEFMVGNVGEVKVGGPAWISGIRPGDEITRINNQPIHDFEELMVNTALSRGPLVVEGKHADGTTFSVTLDPVALKPEGERRRKLGISPLPSLDLPERMTSDNFPITEPGTAAAVASFQLGDKILAVDGQAVTSYREFLAALSKKADDEVELTVSRVPTAGKQRSEVQVKLGRQPGRDLGFRMSMGKVAFLQTDSIAAKAGIQVGDRISKVAGLLVENDLDPFRLTEEFSKRAGEEIEIEVYREAQGTDPKLITLKLTPADRPAWSEPPFTPDSPLSIPSIGLAYHIAPTIFFCDPNGPAATAGIQKLDTVTAITLTLPEGQRDLYSEEIEIGEHNWAHAYWHLQSSLRSRKIQLTVQKSGGETKAVDITPVDSPDWSLQNVRGLNFMVDTEQRRASDLATAGQMGAHYTMGSIRQVYLTLRGLVLGDISITLMSGPIGIAQVAFKSAEDSNARFLLFLGLISINLAVVNFLPIPVLDGGHMVLLLWEGITRRKPNEKIVGIATTIGLFFLLTLIGLVIFLDIFVSKF